MGLSVTRVIIFFVSRNIFPKELGLFKGLVLRGLWVSDFFFRSYCVVVFFFEIDPIEMIGNVLEYDMVNVLDQLDH